MVLERPVNCSQEWDDFHMAKTKASDNYIHNFITNFVCKSLDFNFMARAHHRSQSSDLDLKRTPP